MTASGSSGSWLAQISREVEDKNSEIVMMSQQITPDKLTNNRLIADVLRSINFTDSRIPSDKLNHKSNPKQPYGDLEYAVLMLISELDNDTEQYDFDMTDIDHYLFLMAKILDAAVRHGETETAYAARAGLMNGCFKIRKQLNITDTAIRNNYYQACRKYLDACYLYISVKSIIDISNDNLRIKRNDLGNEMKKLDGAKDSMTLMLKDSPELLAQIREIWTQTYMKNHLMWSKEMLELYEMMVEMRITESGLLFKGYMLESEEKHMFFYREIASKLGDIIKTIPAPEDPNMLAKMEAMMNDALQQAERIDSDFYALGQMMTSFESRLKSMGKSAQQKKMAASTMSDLERRSLKESSPKDELP